MVWRMFYHTYKINELELRATGRSISGMEFKDKSYGDKWDWLDFLATILGGLVGQIIQGIALLLMWKGGVI